MSTDPLTPTPNLTGSIGRSIAVATWALFLGLAMLLLGAGVFGTLIGVRSELDGFGPLTLGLIGSGYYAGFMAGSRFTARALSDVGHIRVYAALACVLSSTILAAAYFTGPVWWVALRFVAGACLAGQYVVAESWLNQLVTNENRAQLLSFYQVLTVVAFGAGQFTFGLLDPQAVAGFVLAAALTTLAVVPVALSEDARPPLMVDGPKITFKDLWTLVPTGLVTSLLVGIAHGAFLGLAAMYATRAGVDLATVGIFIAMPTLGNVLFNVPISRLSDRLDRRLVGVLIAIGATGGGALLAFAGADSALGWVAMGAIGAATYPLYSVAGAYTNDGVPATMLNAVASQLVLMFGAGALAGPLIGSFAMYALGAPGFAWTIVVSHAAIAAFLLVRIVQHPASTRAFPDRAVLMDAVVYSLPATAVGTGRAVRRRVRTRRRTGT